MFKVHLEILRPSRLLRLRSLSRNLTLSENQPCNSNSTASYVHMYTYPCYSHAVKPRNARRLYVRMTSGLCVCETRSKRSVIWSAWLFESDDLKHDGKARQEIHLAWKPRASAHKGESRGIAALSALQLGCLGCRGFAWMNLRILRRGLLFGEVRTRTNLEKVLAVSRSREKLIVEILRVSQVTHFLGWLKFWRKFVIYEEKEEAGLSWKLYINSVYIIDKKSNL